jgi:hypothetical protein
MLRHQQADETVMIDHLTPDTDLNVATPVERRCIVRVCKISLPAIAVIVLALIPEGGPARAASPSFRLGLSAFERQDYVRASALFIPLAERGDPAAQSYLGFMFETGRGVPQSYDEAAMWYRRSAEQGNGAAQYALGLLYDKGYGVPHDVIEADKWLNLASASATPRERDRRIRIRDALATKMSRHELAISRQRAVEWVPVRER